MGRSKFPGKPPKTATRKRIKVLGQLKAAQNDPVTVAENIYYGLSLFNETFGDNDKEHPPFHGFSIKEANLSASYIKTQQHNAENTTDKLPSTTVKNHAPQSNTKKDITDVKNSPTDTENMNNILDQHQRTRQLRNSTAKRLLQRAKSNGSNSRNLVLHSGEKSNTVRKFVLPVRSVHSSRVIKPNKRFIEELEEISGTEHSENEIGMHVKKAKLNLDKFSNRESKLKADVVNKSCTKFKDKEARNKSKKVIESVDAFDAEIVPRQVKNIEKSAILRNQKQISIPTKVLPDSNVPNFESSRVQTRSGTQNEVASDLNNTASFENGAGLLEGDCAKIEHQPENGNKIVVNALNNNFETESNLSESENEQSNHSDSEQSEFSGMKLNGGKVILRKARLKLDNKCLTGTEGPFSTSSTSNTVGGNTNLGLTGTIKCGVCGAVRFYRFVKQARKFGIHSCESCRKFISKMIKRQACAKSSNNVLPILQCHKGDGLCLVPPVVRSQQWNIRCVYKARCPACWLKMCLKCYNIPPVLRTGLNALLPPLMRDPLSISLPFGQDEDGQGQKLGPQCKLSWPSEDSLERNLFKSAMGWRNFEMGQNETNYQSAGSFLYTKIDKLRRKIKSPVLASSTNNQYPQSLRQRVELKGPRVKHVCRSASVALGQPIATFPTADAKEDDEHGKNIPKSAKELERIEKKDEVTKEKEMHKHNEDNNFNLNVAQQSHSRRGKPQQIVSTSHFPVMSKADTDTLYTVSIDFWEQYDPSEVGAKGFALIGSELFHIPAICYLCGSAGKEPLIHCQCCCEPYHAFCLEPSEWNACAQPNWCCPRCTICQSCHLRSGPKLSCIRCRQSFHHSCLSKSGVSSRLYNPDRPYVCQSCIKCKSCGSEGVNVHVGNLPLCSMCFKLRQQGNYCPLCQRCYNENDFDTKMMECSECSCWVHARCEGLSDERYQILSYLPDSIEFTCSQCSSNINSVWRNAIEAELKAGFINVIKSLSKNRKICMALKWSPRKECLCRPVSTVRGLEFPGEDKSETKENEELEEYGSGRKGLRRLRQKFHLRECSVRVKNCVPKDLQDVERKDWTNQESLISSNIMECRCSEQQIIARPSPTLMSIKQRVNGNEYKSLSQFHCDMEHVINCAGSKDLTETYHEILQEVFPWFTPKNFKNDDNDDDTSNTSARDISKDYTIPLTRFEDPILEMWKEEVTKAPKAIATKTINLYNIHVEDSRSCCLCKGLSDGQETKEGRLFYCGQNEWVHANCALWSNEVFEEIDGSLQNVHSAISRGRLIRCTECGKKGASIGCCAKNCSNIFHFPCARNIGLTFNDDKTVFCVSHSNNFPRKSLQNENEFSLKRPIYVELDRKRKKYAEPNKVKIMIGSLMIDCLGTIVPELSDTTEKIIPCDYKCSRLYWSTVNPYKIVRYYIRTYVQVHMPDITSDMENNITIDHTKEQEKEQISVDTQKVDYLAVKQTLDTLIDTVCSKEVDENLAEQSNTDLLPPELKEAIFEDLPHDLLDGISMQDIFPKMSYEDFLAMDLKNDSTFIADLFKDDMLPSEMEETTKPPESKISKMDPSVLELGTHNDLWVRLEAKTAVQDLVDDLFNSKNQKRGGRELKRSKSEVMSNNPLIVGGQRHHHQRSCSLTWSCKLDNTYGPGIKRRKLPRNPSNAKPNETGLIVLDSQNERASMFHELRIPESIMVAVGRGNTPNILSDSVRELKYCIEDSAGLNRRVLPTRDEGAKEHKRLFWHPRQQQPRIVQVDGSIDANSASECSSPEYNTEEKNVSLNHISESIPQLDGINDDEHTSECESNVEKDLDLYTRSANFLHSKRILGFIRSHVSSSNAGDKLQKVRSGGGGNHVVAPSSRCSTLQHLETGSLFKEKNLKLNLQIPQVDGAGDISSDDECVSSQHVSAVRMIHTPYESPAFEHHIDRPVTCKRCCCTYRTQDSYNRHLTNCDIMITSDSDSETMDNKLASPESRFSPNVGSPQFITLSPSEGHTLTTDYTDIQATSPIEASVPSPHPNIQIEPIAQAIITPQIHTAHATVETVHQTVLTSNDVIVQTQYTRRTTTLPNAAVLPSQESTVQITEITDPPSVSSDSNITAHGMVNTPMNSPDSTNSQTVSSPEVSPTLSSMAVQTAHESVHANAQAISRASSKSKNPRIAKSRTKSIKSQQQQQQHILKNVVQTPHNVAHARFQPTIQSGHPPAVIQLQQTTQRPTVILQQVASPGIMSAYVETLQQQSGQNLQYITTIGGGQHEASFKSPPQLIATNSLLPSTTYIQAPSADNLLTLQNGGISILPSVQITPTQPAVLGTIIQQQPSAIQCGVISSEQLLLSSTPTLEMFADPTGGMFVSNQPMYYGLETIVSNTVMSSSQFMAGAVPQVLASSYQTTTQVFQASKLMEPIVDVQAVPTVTTVQAVQNVSGVPSVSGVPNIAGVPNVASMQSVSGVPAVPNASSSSSSSSSLSSSSSSSSSLLAPALPVSVLAPVPTAASISSPQVKAITTLPQINISVATQERAFNSVAPCNAVSPISCQNTSVEQSMTSVQVADVCPLNVHTTIVAATSPTKLSPLSPPHTIPTIPRVAVRPNPITQVNHGSTWKITEPLFEQPMSNSVRPYFDSKHVSENTSMIKSSISSSKIPPLPNHYIIAQRNPIVNNKSSHDVNSVHKSCGTVVPNTNCIVNGSVSGNNSIVNATSVQNKISMPTSNNMPTSRPMNRVLPMQAVTPKQDPVKKDNLAIEEPTKPVFKPAEPEIAESKKGIIKEITPIKKSEVVFNNIKDGIKLNTETIEKVKENLKLELDKEKLQNTSLKIVLQKQLQDGSYKITRNMKATVNQSKKVSPQVTSVEILPSKQVPQIASLQLLPIKTFTLKTNKVDDKIKPKIDAKMNILKAKAPPVAVKKPRIVTKSIRPVRNNPQQSPHHKNYAKGPILMYEIKSQDGFTHTASSMTEVWETVYQAVQNARRAHNLPPLPHNPLSEGLGLENNATVYLVEQLPGINRCSKYKPKFHIPSPPKSGEMENELPAACDNGAVRAEPFKGRKVHDMFSWLASQHRQQPKMISISEAESRRVASTNLPMAMRFRILKETSKKSVGVYHSHIHGRGLFCLRDIEAGEMVIEYAGEVIRSSLTDKREKYYDSKNIGCYMFKIDDHLVVDATMKGNAARFINHSCEPNCYSRVVDILGKKHILIFALRRIIQGEELTYDYKFPFEDIKIPCTCGSRRCRKYLN
ncbi:Histone-lysine N-methyltransferase trithorax, partial [Camponotus floridanus]